MIADVLLQGFGAAGGAARPCTAGLGVAHRRQPAETGAAATCCCTSPPCWWRCDPGAALANIPGLGGNRMAWPTQAGPGGAVGLIVAEYALAAGSDMIGPYGRMFVWAMGAVLAVLLTLLTLGLTAGEWRAAGRAARITVGHGRRGAGMAAGAFRRMRPPVRG